MLANLWTERRASPSPEHDDFDDDGDASGAEDERRLSLIHI